MGRSNGSPTQKKRMGIKPIPFMPAKRMLHHSERNKCSKLSNF